MHGVSVVMPGLWGSHLGVIYLTLKNDDGKWSLNERLRRGGRKRRLGLEAANYLVVGIRESVLEETTVTPLRPGLIAPLILAGLALRPPRALILSRNSAWE